MTTNRQTLERLFAEGRIDLAKAPFLDEVPSPAGEPAWDRVEGMLLGLAIGDALGNPVEGTLPSARRVRFGEIRGYVENRHAGGRRIGLPSDETQLSFWTLEQSLADGALDPARLAARFTAERILGVGSGMTEFVQNVRRGLSWEDCAARSAGNGALMRIAPVLVPHLLRPSPDLWADVALAARLTHDDTASTGSCVAMADLLWKALRMDAPPPPRFWADRFLEVLVPLETDALYGPRGGDWRATFEGSLSEYVRLVLTEARSQGWGTGEALERWWSGAFLLETVPSVLWILEKHAHDPEEAILAAVNLAKDADTAGAIVGAVAGALHGREKLPKRFLEGLPGRTRTDDDGRVFELLRVARERWGTPGAAPDAAR